MVLFALSIKPNSLTDLQDLGYLGFLANRSLCSPCFSATSFLVFKYAKVIPTQDLYIGRVPLPRMFFLQIFL